MQKSYEKVSEKRIDMKSFLFVYIIVLLSFVGEIWAENSMQKPIHWDEEQDADIPGLSEGREAKLDSIQIKASTFLLDTAHWIDSFFDDGRSLSEENKSRATVKLSFGYSKNNRLEVKPRIDVRMKLPRLSRRANLLLEGSDDSDFDVDSNPITRRPANEDAEQGQWRLALRYFLEESEKYNVSFDAGVSWGYLYGGAKLRAIQEFNPWLGRFTNRFRYYTDDGWENKTTYDLERALSKKFFFRSTTGINMFEREEGIPHYQRFSLFQVLSPLKAVAYEGGIYFDTKPSYQMTDVQFIVKYRQRFLRDWLVLEISPRISFPEEYNRQPNPGIIFIFEASFGHDAENEGYKKIFRR